jgi:hypothetical protein
MMGVKCFLMEDSYTVRVSLRRYNDSRQNPDNIE